MTTLCTCALVGFLLFSPAGAEPLPPLARSVSPSRQFIVYGPDASVRGALCHSPSQQLFSAYSFALISFLTNGSENRSRFARYISDLPDSQSDVAADLRTRYRSLSIAETEGQLDTLLHPRFPELSLQSCRLEDYPRFLRLPSRVPVLNQLGTDLMLLGTRANPIYRPIVLGYHEIVSTLVQEKTHRIASRLDQLASARKETGAQMEKIDDYLNWFEATQSQTRSGIFAEYLKVAGKRTIRSRTGATRSLCIWMCSKISYNKVQSCTNRSRTR